MNIIELKDLIEGIINKDAAGQRNGQELKNLLKNSPAYAHVLTERLLAENMKNNVVIEMLMLTMAKLQSENNGVK